LLVFIYSKGGRTIAQMTYILKNIKSFDWDKANIVKSETKHNVKWYECEQIFFNRPLLLLDDKKHSTAEERHFVYGKTDEGRLLTIVFTIRDNKIRVISARPMSRKERRRYESEERI